MSCPSSDDDFELEDSCFVQAHTAEQNNVGNHNHHSAEHGRTDSRGNSEAADISGEASDSQGEVGSKQLGASAANQTRGNFGHFILKNSFTGSALLSSQRSEVPPLHQFLT